MDTRQRTVLVYPVVYPNFFTQVTPPARATPGAYVYILNHLHRSGAYLGNHYQLPFMPIQWVTDMPICGWGHVCEKVWVDHWVDQNCALTSVHVNEILRIALVVAASWCLY